MLLVGWIESYVGVRLLYRMATLSRNGRNCQQTPVVTSLAAVWRYFSALLRLGN
jgi:hypothetical protein